MNKAVSRYPANNCSENLVALCTVCHLGMHRKHRGSILEGQGGLALIVEHRLPPPAMRRKPVAVQLGLDELSDAGDVCNFFDD